MKPIRALFLTVKFIGFYLKALIAANLRIAWDLITPGLQIEPGFIAIPLRTQNDQEILIFSNLVTMTPGTLSLDVSPDRRFLYVHAIYLQNIENVRGHISEDLQSRVLEVLRAWK